MSSTVALHVRFIFRYISLSSSSKRQREMTKFKVYRQRQRKAGSFFSLSELERRPYKFGSSILRPHYTDWTS